MSDPTKAVAVAPTKAIETCVDCGRQTADVYRTQVRINGVPVVVVRCSICWEDAVRRETRLEATAKFGSALLGNNRE